MADVFISYARVDQDRVEPVRHKLECLGVDCFYDRERIDAGSDFADVLDQALRASAAVLCCWSAAYFKSRWCKIECRDALERGRLVPAAIEVFDPLVAPPDLRGRNYLSLHGWDGSEQHDSWRRLLTALEEKVGRSIAPTPTTAEILAGIEKMPAFLQGPWLKAASLLNQSASSLVSLTNGLERTEALVRELKNEKQKRKDG